MGNVFTEWLSFRLGQKARTMKAGARAKAGQKVFGAIRKGQEGAKNKLKGGKKGKGDDEDDDEDDEEDDDEEEEEEEKPKKKKGKGGKGAKGGGGGDDEAEGGKGSKGRAGMAKKGGRGRGRGEDLANKTVAIRISDVEDEPLEVVGWLVALNGNHRGQDFRLHTDNNVIGTAADCDMVLTDPYLSSRHATIRHDARDGSFTIIDRNSTNGSYVNDKRVIQDELIDNDTLRLGRTELKFKALF